RQSISFLGGDNASGRRVVIVANRGRSRRKKRNGTDRRISPPWRSGNCGWRSIARSGARVECGRSTRKIPKDCGGAGTGGEGRDGSGTAFVIRGARGQVHREDNDWGFAHRIEGKSGGRGNRQSLRRSA